MKQIRRPMGRRGLASVCPLKCGDHGTCACPICAIDGHTDAGPSGHCFRPTSDCHKGCVNQDG